MVVLLLNYSAVILTECEEFYIQERSAVLYPGHSIRTLDQTDRESNKTITFYKVQRINHTEREAIWKQEEFINKVSGFFSLHTPIVNRDVSDTTGVIIKKNYQTYP